jgi:ribosomal protein L11 methyltransferase
VVVELRCPVEWEELAADRLLVLGASAVAQGPVPTARDAGPGGAGPPGTGPGSTGPADSLGAPRGAVVLVADLDPGYVAEVERWCAGTGAGLSVRVVEVDPSWADGWRAHAAAHRVGPLTVRPPWVPADGGGAGPEVVVDPGRAFGSGSHPTTRLCLAALVDLVHGGESVLDVGVGSGVLAVAALRLGADRAVGVDIDPEAAAASRACAAANGVAARYTFAGADLGSVDGRFDIVLANLLVGTVEELGPALAGAVRPGGALVVSGILADQRARVLAALGAPGPSPEAELAEEGWVAVVLRCPPGVAGDTGSA